MVNFQVIYGVLLLIPLVLTTKNVLNTCLDSILHKSEPGPESDLFKQCTPWKNRSCCTNGTTAKLHEPLHHNFNLNHCKPLSKKCEQHFIQDMCFYECSPNVGPWLAKVDMKIRKERFFKVPLCKTDCDNWFDDCKNDFTCLGNWLRGWNWTENGNKCPNESKCSKIIDLFGDAKNFCEKVWDDSWKVVDKNQPCMRIWFDGDKNPNDEVALYYTQNSALFVSYSTMLIFFCLLVISSRVYT